MSFFPCNYYQITLLFLGHDWAIITKLWTCKIKRNHKFNFRIQDSSSVLISMCLYISVNFKFTHIKQIYGGFLLYAHNKNRTLTWPVLIYNEVVNESWRTRWILCREETLTWFHWVVSAENSRCGGRCGGLRQPRATSFYRTVQDQIESWLRARSRRPDSLISSGCDCVWPPRQEGASVQWFLDVVHKTLFFSAPCSPPAVMEHLIMFLTSAPSADISPVAPNLVHQYWRY